MDPYGGAIAGAVLGVLTSAASVPAARAIAFAATTRRLLAGLDCDDVDSDAATSVLPHSRVCSLPHGDFRCILQATCSALPSNTHDLFRLSIRDSMNSNV